MPESKINFAAIQKIIEDYCTDDLVSKLPWEINADFKLWLGVSFNEFKEKVHPKYIQRKLERKEIQPNLFNEVKAKKPLFTLNVTLEEWKIEDEALAIEYSFIDASFGEMVLASTIKGVCWLAFVEDRKEALEELASNFSNELINTVDNQIHSQIVTLIFDENGGETPIKIHTKGTDFQYKVWKALLNIPLGGLTTYGAIAERIEMPVEASRAVGTAIGKNTIAFVIPCHRVVRNSGVIGDFRWGKIRKIALIGWEALLLDC